MYFINLMLSCEEPGIYRDPSLRHLIMFRSIKRDNWLQFQGKVRYTWLPLDMMSIIVFCWIGCYHNFARFFLLLILCSPPTRCAMARRMPVANGAWRPCAHHPRTPSRLISSSYMSSAILSVKCWIKIRPLLIKYAIVRPRIILSLQFITGYDFTTCVWDFKVAHLGVWGNSLQGWECVGQIVNN